MTRAVALFNGKHGDKGDTGLPGVSPDEIRASLIDNPMLSLFHQNNVSDTITPTWSRLEQGSISDRYGNLAFVGGDTISNLLAYSEDFSQWEDPGAYWTITNASVDDPLGGTNAKRIKLDQATDPSGVNVMGIPYTPVATISTFSFWIRVITGTVLNVGIQFKAGGSVFTLSDPVTTDWQRITFSGNPFSALADKFYINVYGASGLVFDVFGAQLETNTQLGEYTKTTGTAIDGTNPAPRWRSNQNGYLIEGEKTNLCLFSENLSGAAWEVSGGTISAYTGQDPTGGYNSQTLVNFTSGGVTLSQPTTITDGGLYTVSAWVKITTGTLSSIIAQVGNGTSIPFEQGITAQDGYTRIAITCQAGNTDNFSLTLTSGDSSTKASVFGVQVEVERVSSYISTEDAIASRSPDLVSLPYVNNFPAPYLAWTIIFTVDLQADLSGARYIFHNNLSGNDEFYIYISESTITIKMIGATNSVTLDSGNIELTYDASLLNVYNNASLLLSIAVPSASTVIATTLNIGSNATSINQLNAFLSGFTVYNEALTVNELRYIRGSDADNAIVNSLI